MQQERDGVVRWSAWLAAVKFMSAKQTLKHGNDFPLDAPDAWWEGDATNPPPPKDWAHSAARGVIADLQDRCGIKHGLERGNLDEEIRTEIVEALAAIIREAANGELSGGGDRPKGTNAK